MVLNKKWSFWFSIFYISGISLALAGNGEYLPSEEGFYGEIDFGTAYRSWLNDVTTLPGDLSRTGMVLASTRGNEGYAGGMVLGYQFSQNLSLEGIGFYLPRASFKFDSSANVPNLNINSFLYCASLRIRAQVTENTYIFGKLGAAYTYNKSNNAIASSDLSTDTQKSAFWNPLFDTGIELYVSPSWSINVQYMYIPGFHKASSNGFPAPDTQLLTVGIGYNMA